MYRQRRNRLHSLLSAALTAALVITAGACSDKLPPPTGPGPIDPLVPPDQRIIFSVNDGSNAPTVWELSLRDTVPDSVGMGELYAYGRTNDTRILIENAALTITISARDLSSPVLLPVFSGNWIIDPYSVTVAADGKAAAYMTHHFSTGQIMMKVVRLPDLSQIYQATVIFGNPGVTAEYSRPAFSPDGKRIAWFQGTLDGSYKNPGTLKVVDLKASPPRIDSMIPDGSRSLTAVQGAECVWSPEAGNNKVAVVLSEGGGLQYIAVFDISRREIIGLLAAGYASELDTVGFDWSPDGGSIVFTAVTGFMESDLMIWTRGDSSSLAYPIMITPELAEYSPKWSPDGKTILYLTPYDLSLNGSGDLRMVEPGTIPPKPRLLTGNVVSAFWK